MRVLIVADTLTNRPANPFVPQLLEALIDLRTGDSFSYGVQELFWKGSEFDIIHFQWPEVLFDWKVPTAGQMLNFSERLRRHKKIAAIVTTVHNLDPHPPLGDFGETIFELVYSASDAFIHLSEGAKGLFVQKYGDRRWCRQASHHIVEHGDYAHYARLEEDPALVMAARRNARTRLLLVFGALRSLEEEELARNAFTGAGLENTKLVFAGNPVLATLPPGILRVWRENTPPNVIRNHMRIPDEQVAPLVKASRFVFVPRSGRMNSGIIPLAFTFGVPVIAPDEVLSSAVQAVGGPTYHAGDVNSAIAAIRAAFAMDDKDYADLRDRIRTYRRERMLWPPIARQHARIYVGLTRVHPGQQPVSRLRRALRRFRRRL